MYTVKNIYQQLIRYKKKLIIANILAIIAVLAHTQSPLFIPMLIDEVLLDKPGFITNTANYLFGEKDFIFYIFFALFITVALRTIFFIFDYIQTKMFTIISKQISFEIREALLRHLQKISLSEYEFFGPGKAASLMVVDIETIDEFISRAASSFITSVLHIVFIAVILLYINWQMAALIFLLNPMILYLTTKLSKRIARYKKEQNKAYQDFGEDLNETLNQFVQVRASNQEVKFVDRLVEKSNILKEKSSLFMYKKFGAHSLSVNLFITSADILRVSAILIVALYQNMSIGQIIAVFSYLWMVMRPMEAIVDIQYSYSTAKVALKRINEIFSLKQEPQYPHLKNPFSNSDTNSVNLKSASFAYDRDNYIFKDLDLSINKGEKVAFVGRSGGGKTTLAQIIVGFYPLNSGELLFDDTSIKEIGQDVVRENVFLVLQNPELFNDTIKYNLTLGKEIDEDEIWKALEIAQLRELISNLPDMLETRVGNHGMKLSGGQRQRLAIARMILKNPNIVILDESTSALDNETEINLFLALEEFLKDKTTIIIAHRLSTIKNVDTIFLFKNGKMNKINSYEELINKEYEYET